MGDGEPTPSGGNSGRETVTIEAEIEPYQHESLREWADAMGADVEEVAGDAIADTLEEWDR